MAGPFRRDKCELTCHSSLRRKARRSTAVNHDLAAAISVNHLQCGAGGYLPSPQVLAGEPLIEDGGFASRGLDSVGAVPLCGNPRNLLRAAQSSRLLPGSRRSRRKIPY
jgi:hypothetical protein